MPKVSSKTTESKKRPAMSAEAVENRLINKSYKAVEERIDNGSATAAELIHFLRLGSTKEQLELEKLKKENELLKAKAGAIRSQEETKEMYENAIKAFNKYSGHVETIEDDDY